MSAKTNTKLEQGSGSESDDSTCCLSSLAEMEALEIAVQRGRHQIMRVQEQLAAMHAKQAARQHELGYQKARMRLKPSSRVSDEARPGHRMVIVQTDSGISTRWIPDNAPVLAVGRDGPPPAGKTL